MNAQTAFLLFVALVVLAVIVASTRPKAASGDIAITAAVNEAIAKEFPLASIHIDAKTFDGAVILGGVAREFSQAKRAEEIARGIAGVKSVESRITIRSGG